jgi:hypothetical protein
MGTVKRNTKLGMGDVGGPATQAARMRRSSPPASVNCPAPRVPTFDPLGTPTVPPTSGSRKRRTTVPPHHVDEVAPASITAAAKLATPRLSKKKRDLADAPIDNREAFLLTRIDGQLNVEDLADLTGMPLVEVSTIVQRLARLGLVVL